MKLRLLLVLALVAAVPALTRATVVVRPSFDQLVERADLIIEGEVVDVRARWDVRAGERVIVSDVTIRVRRTLKGTSSAQVVLQFFGGTVGKYSMQLAGMPPFAPGDRSVLFLRNDGGRGYPLVGLMHGRFRIARGADGVDRVTTFDDRTIGDVSQIGEPLAPRRTASPPMTADAFASAIVQRVASPRASR